MSIAPERQHASLDLRPVVERKHTVADTDPLSSVEWEWREARIPDLKTGKDAFYAPRVEFPKSWSQNATNIVAQKYFRVINGERETSLKQVIGRIVETITEWGVEEGYFADMEEATAFADELAWRMVNQHAAFNSPVWFNIGVPGVPQQCSACYILHVDDDMKSILNWYVEEGIIFKGGSGAGINLSTLRGSEESLSGGGRSSGPVTFMRGADASAGTIKSGGTTRRAAKMVILDADHPDIERFIWCKAEAERKTRVLAEAGYDMDLDGKDAPDIPYQNANNSVRLSDEFMRAVVDDRDWSLVGRVSGEVIKTVRARELLRQIAEAAWECADPGIQFDTTINRWHTSPAWGRITGSNPCSEYVSNDNTSCNLASLRLTKFLRPDGSFDADDFAHCVRVMFTAQDILICRADSPTEKIAEGTKAHRQIGLGFMDLGAMLMALGLPYDSDEGRDLAAGISSLMTAQSYAVSTELALRLGPYPAFHEDGNEAATKRVLGMHYEAARPVAQQLVNGPYANVGAKAVDLWMYVTANGIVRNSQATLLAPTGTIAFACDADTTSGEPDLGLVKNKKLVGGGVMRIVNQTVPIALRRLGYPAEQVDQIVAYIDEHETAVGAPHLRAEHLPVFACAMGEPVIEPMGHIKMLGALQPHLSGAISKTVNCSESTTVEDFENLTIAAWRMGVKCVAFYRDGSKVGQPLSTGRVAVEGDSPPPAPRRTKLPKRRPGGGTLSFRVGEAKGYMTVNTYEDGRPGEIFLKVAKQGSTLGGILDAFAIQISHSLQYGEPLKDVVAAHVNSRFEPWGMTDDPEIRTATSMVDYVVRRMAVDFLPVEERIDLGILTIQENAQPSLLDPGLDGDSQAAAAPQTAAQAVMAGKEQHKAVTDRLCGSCGGRLVRAGVCFCCETCGTTTGCS